MNDIPDTLSLDELRARHRRLLARLEENERAFRRLARSVWRVQEDERRRLARELHDGIGQNLTALKHRLATLGCSLAPGQDELRQRLEGAIALCAQTLEDTRQLARLLRPQILDDLGLEAALRWLARSLDDAGGARIALEMEALPTLEGDLQTLVFRLAQEALTNAVRHAGAQEILLRLVVRGDHLQLQVVDDGRGCDPDAALRAGGTGLGGMRERVRLYGGQFALHSAPGAGTRLQVRLPLDGGERDVQG